MGNQLPKQATHIGVTIGDRTETIKLPDVIQGKHEVSTLFDFRAKMLEYIDFVTLCKTLSEEKEEFEKSAKKETKIYRELQDASKKKSKIIFKNNIEAYHYTLAKNLRNV